MHIHQHTCNHWVRIPVPAGPMHDQEKKPSPLSKQPSIAPKKPCILPTFWTYILPKEPYILRALHSNLNLILEQESVPF